MLGKRMHSNSSKNGMLGRNGCKGKDAMSKTTTARYNKNQVEACDVDIKNITFPYLRPSDNAELLPCYTSILGRTIDEGIGMKDLDQLQQELEKLLSTTVLRNRILCSEFELIDRVEERHEKRGKFFDKPLSPKCRKVEEKTKHVKDSKPAYKLVKNFHDEIPKVEVPRVILPKNDTKSKFWLSVDPYCAPVAGDDTAYLDELIQEVNKDVDLKLTEIGPHYTEEWSLEAHQDATGNVIPRVSKNKGNSSMNGFCSKKNGYFAGESYTSSVILPLASALLEENVSNIPVPQETLKEIGMKPVNNAVCLDKRLRNELVELGILDPEENTKTMMQDDEITQEIKLCQSELAKINECNRRELNRLRNLVNKDMARQEYIQKLDEVDNKVMDVYNKLLTANQKNRNEIEWEAVRVVQMQKQLHTDAMEITDYLL